MSKRDFSRLRHAGKPTDKPPVKPTEAKGGWSHISREPVRIYTQEEKDEVARRLGL